MATKKNSPKTKVKKPSSCLAILYKPSPTKVKEKRLGRISIMYKNSADLVSIKDILPQTIP